MKNYRQKITTRLRAHNLPDAHSFDHHRPAAAVLVGIIEDDEPRILLTRRADHLSSHAGQISFPGGHWEEEDEDLIATALREAQEEVGLDSALVEISGVLRAHHTGGSQPIVPIVGFVRKDARLQACADEVAEIFSVPLSFLMESENYNRRSWTQDGQTWRYHVIVWQGREIWGATANILRSFYDAVFAEIKEEG